MTNPKSLLGVGQALKDIFRDAKEPARDKDAQKPTKQQIDPGYPQDKPIEDRVKHLIWRYYRESSFEKVQFSRKWMRNALMFQGYHELEWSEINVAWEAIIRDSGDYAFPNNYYRTYVMDGAGLYVKNAPQFVAQPLSDDYEAQAVATAAHSALEVSKENVHYDAMRTKEAIFLRLFGNSFRYSYYSLDPRYGHIVAPVYEKKMTQVGQGGFQCPNCGGMGEGTPPLCPYCGAPLPPESMQPPLLANVPHQVGSVEYPRGQEVSEVVTPFEVYVRGSSPDLWNAPFLIRVRIVDKLALQADFPDVDLGGGYTEGGGGDAYAASQDLSLIYQQSLADLPGDPTQYAAWYERATSFARSTLLQGWIRPSQYSFDEKLKEEYPDGIYAAVVGDKLLESRSETMDDHWVHFPYILVPGRFWGDGDDDIVPKQLQLNETERLVMRNEAYASSPQLVIDSQRIDRNSIVNDPSEIIEAKITGRPVKDAIHQMQGQALPNETWQWRAAILQDIEHHSGVFGPVIGKHQPGVNTYGGQMDMASRAEQTLSPLLLLYKEANERWARQMLKIAAENWLDDRVHAVMGINGDWEFTKLKREMLQLDRVRIVAKLIPVDYSQQQGLIQAVTGGLLSPQDPRVQRKALELFQLPTELSTFSTDAKVQWKEIDKMKEGQQVQPVLLRDNDQVHAEICRTWLNSDEAERSPQEVVMMVLQHMQAHIINAAKAMQVVAAMQLAPQEIAAGIMGGGETRTGRPVGAQEQAAVAPQTLAGQGGGGQPPQGGRRGGQVPPSGAKRQQRAQRGAAAKPNRPQPPSGNQYRRGR